jgi:predicted NBD/HSP70 family sugar kinase
MRSALSDSAREVFIALATRGNATRPQLAAACALSKPTVSAAVAELESLGFAERSGTSYGATGRSAAVYRLGPRAGYVLAVDRGSTQVAYRAVGLDGALLDHAHTDHPESAGEMIHAALKRRADCGGPLRAAVVAVSDVVAPPDVVARGTADPVIDRRVRAALDALGLPADAPVAAENNVNCAAIAELHEASDGSRDTFVYLQVGVGIGAGLVIGRRLIRGANGAAGEVARLAYPWADGIDAGHEALEARLGSAGLLERAASRWPGGREAAPRTAADLFALAEGGLAAARELVEEHAAHVGKLAASLAAVLDPGLVILGGGVGGNPLLTDGVAAALARLSWPTSVLVSTLGDQATVLGAALLARERGVLEAVAAG